MAFELAALLPDETSRCQRSGSVRFRWARMYQKKRTTKRKERRKREKRSSS
jgi:hypothetical protein